ncbi:MAG: lipopolysaccharide heptosyltransferase II [Verrucomicrobia bacterium]|nr:MAG: lipopolysaccharide heptosyltransferase II [Verrucomicrobiota bacterium]
MFDYPVYLLYRAGTDLLVLLPLPFLFAMGQICGAIAWLFLPQYRKLALRNVRIAFGDELSETEMRRIVRRHFRWLGANLLCSVKFTRMPMEKILERVRLENFELVENCFRQNKPFVLLISHIGSWEFCTRLSHFSRGQRTATIYQRIRNRHIDRHVRKARSRFGLEVFERSEGFGKAIELLRSGGGIGILMDQHAGDGGLWTPVFGRLASTTPLPALLARRTHAKLIGFAVHTEGFARWRAVAETPIDGVSESIEKLTAHSNEILEKQVRRAPEDWFWVHNRWKTPRPNFLLSRYKRGIFLPEKTRLKPFRILIRSSNWLGDAVMSVPAVRAIKGGRPDAHVSVAVPEKLAPLWKIVSEVDEIIALPSKSVFVTARLFRQKPPFDVAILFPNSLRSALEVFLADIPRRVGLTGHWRRWLLNQGPRKTFSRGIVHQTYKYLELATTVGAKVTPQFPAANPIKSRRAQFKFALCPGAEYGPAKRWPRFAEVTEKIAARFPVRWILFGTPGDETVGLEIAKKLGGKCVNRIGQTTLGELIDELSACDLLLTNDTGTMHLAALLRVPTISIFGSTEPLRTGPLGRGHRIFRHHVECSPCFLRECPLDFRCMHAVTSAEVVGAIQNMISEQADPAKSGNVAFTPAFGNHTPV